MPLQVYKGKGRYARRIEVSRPGGLFFRLFTHWLRSGLTTAR